MTVEQIRRQEQPGLARGQQITRGAQTSSSCSLGGVRWRVSTSSPHFHPNKSPLNRQKLRFQPVRCWLLCWWDDYFTTQVRISELHKLNEPARVFYVCSYFPLFKRTSPDSRTEFCSHSLLFILCPTQRAVTPKYCELLDLSISRVQLL